VGLPPRERGFGRPKQAPNLIDSSFFGVYTDPSKPPVIGDLAGLMRVRQYCRANPALCREEPENTAAASPCDGILPPNCSLLLAH
jgi:hypothetical protein